MLCRRIVRAFCQDYQALAARMVAESEKIAQGLSETQLKEIKNSMTKHQLLRIEKMAKIMADFHEDEFYYVNTRLEEELHYVKEIPLLTLYTDWPSIKPLEDGTYPAANPNWFLQQESLASMFPGGYEKFAELFAGAVGGGGGGGNTGNAVSTGGPKVEIEEKKVEEVLRPNL